MPLPAPRVGSMATTPSSDSAEAEQPTTATGVVIVSGESTVLSEEVAPIPEPNDVSAESEATEPEAATSTVDGAGLGSRPPPMEEPTEVATDPMSAEESIGDESNEPAPEMDVGEMPATDDEGASVEPGGFGGFGGFGEGVAEPDEEPDMEDTGAGDGEGDEGTEPSAEDPPASGGFGTAPPTMDGASDPSAPACTSIAVGAASGDVGTEAVCFVVSGTVAGWQVSNLGSRSLTINGAVANPPSLPAASNGEYRFEFSAGDPYYTAFSSW